MTALETFYGSPTVSVPAESARVAGARARAAERLRRQRGAMRPLGLVLLAAIGIAAVNGQPAPASHGTGLGVVVALAVFAVTLLVTVRDSFTKRSVAVQSAVIAAMGAAGIALVALQPHGATTLGGGAAVWMALTRLPLVMGLVVGGAIAVGLCLALLIAGAPSGSVVASGLLSVLLGLAAYFIKQARASQDRTELLLAELEDAREEQLAAAAVTERTRIAGELHDVLAHSLSGAAIQLQGARKLAERDGATGELRNAIDRAGGLVREGLGSAREAVGALRGHGLPGVGELDTLVASFRDDLNANVTLTVEGTSRALAPEVGLALYRGAQEALTNVVRYAPGTVTSVVLRYEDDRTTLTVVDTITPGLAEIDGLGDAGGGRGLAVMRERVERAGGRVNAGPTESGWRVELVMPG
jgi:signal transduction histidine kinase